MDELNNLINVDNGRFKPVLSALKIDQICFKCHTFDETQEESYRCAIFGKCIGVTLSSQLNQYLLKHMKK